MQKPIVHVAVAIVRCDERWLIARRSQDAHLGGLWEYPGGKIEPGEDARDAALRELHEECGVRATVLCELTTIPYEYEDRVVHITPVVCEWRAGEAQARGNAECRWVKLGELRETPMPPANAGILAALERL